jgi:hypothetical protein
MAVSVEASGTQTAVINTEHTLRDVNTVGTFQFYVDMAALAATEVVELRMYQIILTGGTRRLALPGMKTFTGALADPNQIVYYFDPISNDLTDTGSLRFTLKQTSGTGRAFPWKVLKYV